jgi:hypothetical protein
MNTHTDPIYTVRQLPPWMIHDRPDSKNYLSEQENKAHMESLLFHVSKGDYLSTLATVLRFFEETIHDKGTSAEMREKQLKNIQIVMSDLLYLNDNFDIVPKSKKD